MIRGYIRKLWPTLPVVIALCSLAGPAFALTSFTLTAKAGTMVLPGSATQIPIWGFATGTPADGNQPTLPGPLLEVPTGETTVQITLNNTLDVPVSLLIPGLPVAAGGQDSNPPVATAAATTRTSDGTVFDSTVPNAKIPVNPNFPLDFGNIQPKSRVLSLTSIVAQPGGSASYTINVTGRQGTYIYESGTHQQIQLPMGLYGAMVIGPGATGAAYDTATAPLTTQTTAQITYDQDQVVVFSEILGRYDWTLTPPRFVTFNEAVAAAVTPGSTTVITNLLDYAPLYYLINGKGYPDTIAPTPISAAPGAPTVPGMFAPPGKKTLIRLVNAGRENRVPTIQGAYLDNIDPTLAKPHAIYSHVIAEDGRLYNYANQEFAPILPAGKSMDVMVDLTNAKAPGYYTLYDRRLSLNNAGVYPGGMITFLASWDPTSTDTRIKDCSPFKGDINGDGKINLVDAVMALQAVVNNGYYAAGDITPLNNGLPCGGDGLGGAKTVLSPSDALFILQKAVGLNPY
jgi:FtsP/CotA-like multicopper oxidase with cupredoxin domain